MNYDGVFLHPPAIFDFKDKPYFPGPIAYTVVNESTDQFIIPPVGELSIAEYLDRHGYKVVVDNIGERMLFEEFFDVKKYLSKINARVIGIDLHWCIHIHGAINLAKTCKELHPNSLIVLGGLTATRFHDEIIQKYNFIDVVIKGEAEEAFLKLMESVDKYDEVRDVPNITFRVDGRVKSIPQELPVNNLDKYEFTRLDLLQPKSILFSTTIPPFHPHWALPICRGCTYNCKTCGGSAYFYRKYFGRDKPAPRSPEKIVEDLEKLSEQGVNTVFLFQDPRICGKKYFDELFITLKREGVPVNHLTLELFSPIDEDYASKVSKLDVSKTLTISPESGSENVRRMHGRNYSNEQLFNTIKICQQNHIPLLVFFMIPLAYENNESIKETWNMWEKICIMDEEARDEKNPLTVGYGYGQMILMDPGSLAFDMPQNHGYRLVYKTLEEHLYGLSQPSWHQWINYETTYFDKKSIAELILDSLEYSIDLRERFGIYNRLDAFYERFFFVNLSRLAIEEIDKIMQLEDAERNEKLQSLYIKLRQIMNSFKK